MSRHEGKGAAGVWGKAMRGVLITLALLAAPVEAGAQATAPAGTGLTQQQFDQLVDSLTKAVSDRLAQQAEKTPPAPAKPGAKPAAEAKPGAAKPGAAAPAAAPAAEAEEDYEELAAFMADAGAAVLAVPRLVATWLRIPGLLDESPRGGNGTLVYLLLLALSVAAALGAERVARMGLRRLRDPWFDGHDRSVVGLGSLVVVDLLAIGALWVVCHGAIGAFFHGTTGQARLAAAVLTVVVQWRLVAMMFRIFLRPERREARLALIGDTDAHAIYRSIAAMALGLSSLRLLMLVVAAIETDPAILTAGRLVNGLLAFSLLQWGFRAAREPFGRWFASFVPDKARNGIGAFLAAQWFWILQLLLAVLLCAQIQGAVTQHLTVGTALQMTLMVVSGLVLFETLLRYLVQRGVDAENARVEAETAAALAKQPLAAVTDEDGVVHVAPPPPPVQPLPLKVAVAVRCVRVAVLILAGVLVAQSWVVDVFSLVDASAWRRIARSSATSGIILFAAYVVYEIVEYFSAKFRAAPAAMPGAGGSEDDQVAVAPPSRIATIMPLLRVAVLVLTGIVALLLVLSELGVNITPLIAGASVLGLAVSFGSQSLVKDVVSGVFFLADDAFRVGEYIECGKAKGTVEGFTLRSLKLRHQNGMVHTIPYGQLGQITNFSRDWTTVKFNLRMARSTDIEKLRKTTKKVGIALAEDPEFKDQFLSPLKLQGVADVADNALIMRFKFTARPNMPSLLQREGLKRLYRAFQENGIEFASATVTVQTPFGVEKSPADASAFAGAAANASLLAAAPQPAA
jgi:small-conductance mechanosensitive channel